jgi:nitrogen fixation NifU-like protein
MEGDQELRELYQDVLLDYFQSSAHKGKIENADFQSRGINPVCGDEIEITMSAKASGGVIEKIRYNGHGCVISQASSAMMAECLEGKTPKDAQALISAFKDMMLSKTPIELLPADLGPVKALEGVRKFPLRVKCATLAWNTIQKGFPSAEEM